MSFDPTALARIVAKANASVLAPKLWSTVLEDAAQCIGANGAALVTPNPVAGVEPFCVASGSSADSAADYLAHWRGHDAWLAAAATHKEFEHAGTVGLARSVLPVSMLRRTAFHNDFLRVADVEDCATLKVFGSGDARAPEMHLSFFRPPSRPAFESHDCLILRELWPHLQRALHTHYLLRKVEQLQKFAESALDAMPQLVWVLREDGKIDFANRAALQVTMTAQWMRIKNEYFHRLGDLDDVAIRLALRSAACGGNKSRIAVIELDGRLRRVVLHVAPLDLAAGFAERWPHAKALLILQLPSSVISSVQWLARLGELYRLTAAELRVLCLLGDGLQPKAIADELQVSLETVRTHLGVLYEKTGCRRQAALVRLLNA